MRAKPKSGQDHLHINCAQCGEPLYAPTWREPVSERCTRYLWNCEICGYQFETAAYLPIRKPEPVEQLDTAA